MAVKDPVSSRAAAGEEGLRWRGRLWWRARAPAAVARGVVRGGGEWWLLCGVGGSWNRQVLGVAHFVEMRHQEDPYAWRISTKCATHKEPLGGAFWQNAPPLRVF
jgi:hypothetical protein